LDVIVSISGMLMVCTILIEWRSTLVPGIYLISD